VDYVGAVDGYLAKHPEKSKSEAFEALEINQANYYNQRSRLKKTKAKKVKHPERKTSGKTVIEVEGKTPFGDFVVAFVGTPGSVRASLDGWLR
jgi:hypothetical protein